MKSRILVLAALAFAVAAPSFAQTNTLDKIRKSGAITLGYIDGAAPFSSLDANKQPQGYSVDLCRAVANGIRTQLGLAALDTRWVALTIQNRLEAVRSGKVDIECSTTTWTLSRQTEVDFSLITFVDGGSIVARAETNAGRLTDFDGKRVAVIGGTTTERVLREALKARSINAQITTVKTRPEGFKLVDEGKVDGFASDRTTLIGVVLASKTGRAYRLLDEDFSIEPYVLTLPRGDHDFRLAVNRVLAQLFRSGEIERVYNHWLGALGPPSLLLSAAYFVQSLAE